MFMSRLNQEIQSWFDYDCVKSHEPVLKKVRFPDCNICYLLIQSASQSLGRTQSGIPIPLNIERFRDRCPKTTRMWVLGRILRNLLTIFTFCVNVLIINLKNIFYIFRLTELYSSFSYRTNQYSMFLILILFFI